MRKRLDKGGGPFCQKLRHAIRASGLSLNEISQKANVDRGALSRFMRAERLLSHENFADVAIALGLDLLAKPGPSEDDGAGMGKDFFDHVSNRFLNLMNDVLAKTTALFENSRLTNRLYSEAYCAIFKQSLTEQLLQVKDVASLREALRVTREVAKNLCASLRVVNPDLSDDIEDCWNVLWIAPNDELTGKSSRRLFHPRLPYLEDMANDIGDPTPRGKSEPDSRKVKRITGFRWNDQRQALEPDTWQAPTDVRT